MAEFFQKRSDTSEEVRDIDKELEEILKQQVAKIKYFASFDPQTGEVTGIHPSHAISETVNKVEINDEIAFSVFEGKTKLSSYRIDITDPSLSLVEIKSLSKIDDVLHRVVDKQWSTNNESEVYVSYNRKSQSLTFELSNVYGGTKNVNSSSVRKKILWDGSTEILFLVSAYNDPNEFFYTLSLQIQDLIESKKTFDNIVLPKNFSVYTRRIFKNYIIEEV